MRSFFFFLALSLFFSSVAWEKRGKCVATQSVVGQRMTGAEKLALTVAMGRLHTCQNTFLSIPICYAISPLFTLLEADFFSFFFFFFLLLFSFVAFLFWLFPLLYFLWLRWRWCDWNWIRTETVEREMVCGEHCHMTEMNDLEICSFYLSGTR